MPGTFYAPGAARAARVEDLFGTIAPRYDLINDLQSFRLHRVWKKRVLQRAKPQAGERALDLCCGTADLALALARTGVSCVGVDFSLPMLEVATDRLRRSESGLQPVSTSDQLAVPDSQLNAKATTIQFPLLVRGDALDLPFADETFDLVTIGYGLRNLASVPAGLAEMRRVLKPGGRAFILDFGKPANALLRACYFAYLRAFVPLFGRIFCGNSATHRYIYESLLNYPAQEGVAKSMRDGGWTDVAYENLAGGIMSINWGHRP